MGPKYYVYIFADGMCRALFIGVTDDLFRRSAMYRFRSSCRLVYYEAFEDRCDARFREQCLKDWRREWRRELIEAENPDWHDLSGELD